MNEGTQEKLAGAVGVVIALAVLCIAIVADAPVLLLLVSLPAGMIIGGLVYHVLGPNAA